MTCFGRGGFEVEGIGFSVELRSVNHRHLDVSVRLPRALSSLEPVARKLLRGRFARGKVEVAVSGPPGAGSATLALDPQLARRYLDFAQELHEGTGVAGELDVATLVSLPGVARLVEHALPLESVEAGLADALETAVEAALAMRAAEGEALEKELRSRLAAVVDLVGDLEGGAETVVEAALARLRRRAEQIRQETGLGDDARLQQEIMLAADRLDVTEELVRLRSHADQFYGALDGAAPGNPVGRRLEFLLQEMLREANTIGSKASDAGVAHRVVDLKTELERIREQVQNVE